MAKVLKTTQSKSDWQNDNRSRNSLNSGGRNDKQRFNSDETKSTTGKSKCFVFGRVGHIAKAFCERKDKAMIINKNMELAIPIK